MTGSDLLKYGLLGGAAYLGYQYFTKPRGAQVTTTAIGTKTTQPPVSVLRTKELVLAKARAALAGSTVVDFSNELLNFWEWCYYYNQVRGEGACDKIKAAPADPARRISIDEFWTLAEAG